MSSSPQKPKLKNWNFSNTGTGENLYFPNSYNDYQQLFSTDYKTFWVEI